MFCLIFDCQYLTYRKMINSNQLNSVKSQVSLEKKEVDVSALKVS